MTDALPVVTMNHQQSETELARLAEKVLDYARAAGATEAEVSLSRSEGFDVTVRKGEIDTLEHNRDKYLSVTIYRGQCKGTASSTELADVALQQVVSKANDIASVTASDPYAGLAKPQQLAQSWPDLELYSPWTITPQDAIDLARQIESHGMETDSRISNSDGASVSTHGNSYANANSHGFCGAYSTTRHQISCCLIAEADGSMQRDYDYAVSRSADELNNPMAIAASAAHKAVARLGGKPIATQTCPVIFQADVARGLLGHFIGAISGGNLYRNASFLLDSLNKSIFPQHISVSEQPHLKRALGSVPFDNEGVAISASDIVTDGVLQRYVLNSYAARKLGLTTTGNAGGVHNVRLSHSNDDFNALLKRMGRGLVVTELIGHGVDLVTGDYSRGICGFWVENGQIVHPVEEVTIAGNLADIFHNIDSIGNDIDKRGNLWTGSILINEMMVAGH